MTTANYQLLGREWPEYFGSVPEAIASWKERTYAPFDYPDPVGRSYQIESRLFYPALHHLGFDRLSAEFIRDESNIAFDMSIAYFTGDWWQLEQITRLSPEVLELVKLRHPVDEYGKTREERLEIIARRMDKTRHDREMKWFDAFTGALFFGGLLNRWDELGRICAWFDATIEPDFQSGPSEYEYMLLFVCMAGSLSPQPMSGAEELLTKIKKCRSKRPRLLCAAWEAAMAVDQFAFDKAFKQTVDDFLSKQQQGPIYKWVAIHQSSVLFIAERQGLKCPSLSEKQRAAVVTRQSAGITE